MVFETLTALEEGAVLIANITAPPMNLLGPALVRDLVALIQHAENDDSVQVIASDPSHGPRARRSRSC